MTTNLPLRPSTMDETESHRHEGDEDEEEEVDETVWLD